jgi:hypothetical protein
MLLVSIILVKEALSDPPDPPKQERMGDQDTKAK